MAPTVGVGVRAGRGSAGPLRASHHIVPPRIFLRGRQRVLCVMLLKNSRPRPLVCSLRTKSAAAERASWREQEGTQAGGDALASPLPWCRGNDDAISGEQAHDARGHSDRAVQSRPGAASTRLRLWAVVEPAQLLAAASAPQRLVRDDELYA